MNYNYLLQQLGERLTHRRINLEMTQTELAEHAGVSKRTVERLEAGHSTQMSNFLRILTVLGLQDALLNIVPAEGPSPMELLKLKGRERKRASPKRAKAAPEPWTWNDSA